MKKIIFITVLTFLFLNLNAKENLKYFVNKAIENNLLLNAERKKLESAIQNRNISRSEFLPSVTISGDQTSTTSINRTDQNGLSLPDSNIDSESKTISIEQKVFSGFKGVNTFKKSELETQKAKLELKEVEQKTVLNTAYAYYDLIYKFKSQTFNKRNLSSWSRYSKISNTYSKC